MKKPSSLFVKGRGFCVRWLACADLRTPTFLHVPALLQQKKRPAARYVRQAAGSKLCAKLDARRFASRKLRRYALAFASSASSGAGTPPPSSRMACSSSSPSSPSES